MSQSQSCCSLPSDGFSAARQGGRRWAEWVEIWSCALSWILLIFSQEHSLPGSIAWREGVAQTMSCHPMIPAGQLATSLWLKLKQITQLPVIKHLGGSGSPWWPRGQRSQQVLDPPNLGPAFLPVSSRFSSEELRDFAGLKTTKSKTKHQPARRTNVGILTPSSRLYG